MTLSQRLALSASPVFFVAAVLSGVGDDANSFKFLANLLFGGINLFYGLGAFTVKETPPANDQACDKTA